MLIGEDGVELNCKKVTKDQWRVETDSEKTIVIKYSYYAFQMDAGNSWLDDEQLYLNFINCLVYAEGRLNDKCEVEMKVPKHYQFATGLKQSARNKIRGRKFLSFSRQPACCHCTATES